MNVIEVQGANILEEVEAFLDAAYRADLEGVSGALANGLSADVVDDSHTTALQIAAAQGNLAMVTCASWYIDTALPLTSEIKPLFQWKDTKIKIERACLG